MRNVALLRKSSVLSAYSASMARASGMATLPMHLNSTTRAAASCFLQYERMPVSRKCFLELESFQPDEPSSFDMCHLAARTASARSCSACCSQRRFCSGGAATRAKKSVGSGKAEDDEDDDDPRMRPMSDAREFSILDTNASECATLGESVSEKSSSLWPN